MTDGVTLNPGVGGAKIATDALATINGAPVPEPVHVQRTKVGFGPDGDFRDVDGDHPLPVEVSFPDLQSVSVSNFPETQAVSAESLPLPSGAATAALQTTGNTSLAAIQSALAGTLGIAGSVTVSNFPATQAISAASLPLPTGAATAAAQATGNTALAAISGQLPATLGQKAMAGSLPVTLASDQSALPVTVGNFPATQVVSAASLPLPSGAATAALQTTGNTSLAAIQSALAGTLGIAGSVTVSNFPATQAISAAALPLPTGAATAAAQATANTALAAISGQLPATRGQKAMAASLPVTLASDQSAVNVSPDNVLDNATVSGSANGAATVVSASTAGFMGGSFQVTNAGTSCIVTYEQSNDGTNWVGLPVTPSASPTTVPATTSTAAGHFFYVSSAAFVRARVSTYGSGTVAVTLVQKRAAIPSSGISLQQSSAIIGLVTISGNPVLGASSSTIGNILRQSGFTDSSTTLAASATFTGTGRALNTAIWTRFAATAFADQAGTLFIDLSLDTGTTWRQIASVAVAANVAQQLSVLTTGAAGAATLYRVRYTNGSTVQGAFQLSSAFLGN